MRAGGVGASDREPRVILLSGAAAAGFENSGAVLDLLLGELPLGSPPSAQVAQLVVGPVGECPGGGGGLLDGELVLRLVGNDGAAADDAGSGVDGVDEVDKDFAGDVFGSDGELVALDLVRDIMQH